MRRSSTDVAHGLVVHANGANPSGWAPVAYSVWQVCFGEFWRVPVDEGLVVLFMRKRSVEITLRDAMTL